MPDKIQSIPNAVRIWKKTYPVPDRDQEDCHAKFVSKQEDVKDDVRQS